MELTEVSFTLAQERTIGGVQDKFVGMREVLSIKYVRECP
jgi:hypothetical protein